jgi:antitoxin component YwqK of YwqJK toxin-antitoxin module
VEFSPACKPANGSTFTAEMKILSRITFIVFLPACLTTAVHCMAQDVIDVVDPYQMKVSRSRQADTFYFSQKNIPQKAALDTLKTYDVFLEERPTPFGKAYMCNGREVTKQKFNDYKMLWNASLSCKPCMLYTYDDKDALKHIAYQYQDCLCGSFVEYYPRGAKKVVGQFKENTSGSWDNMKSRDLCNIRVGTWIYYYPTGMVEKTEVYADGKLQSVTTPSTFKKTANSSDAHKDSETQKGWLRKMKSKNRQTDN